MFKDISEAIIKISSIKYDLDEMKEKLTNKTIRRGYQYLSFDHKTVTVYFDLDYHDWLKLEKSKKWKAFLKRLQKLQDEYCLEQIHKANNSLRRY